MLKLPISTPIHILSHFTVYLTPISNPMSTHTYQPTKHRKMAEGLSKEEQISCATHVVGGGGGGDLFNELPEDCIAAIISSTTPMDACRVACVSKIFKSVAYSDAVWARFLPSDLPLILSRSHDSRALLDSMSKRDLFFLLSLNPILIDGGSKSILLERSTGKKCCGISARDLAITWGDTPRYWSWHSLPESRFSEVAELINVCWLEIRGKVKASMLSPETNYAAYFVFKMTESVYGFYSPADVSVKVAGGKTETRNMYLDPQEVQNRRQIIPRRIGVFNRIQPAMTFMQPAMQQEGDGKQLPRKRGDGWMEVEIGEFFNPRRNDEYEEGEEHGDVEMSVLEVNAGNWKGGLVVEGFEIRPKVNVEMEAC